jgi:hydrogenase maturation protease
MTETLILGLGNPLRGDDGIGPAVIDWLCARGVPPDVTTLDDGAADLGLVLTLADYRRVIVVDAADMGRAPGEWARFTPDRLRLEHASRLSLHAAGLSDVLALSAALGLSPEAVIIYGVQPASVDWSAGLSAEAQRAVPEVGRAVFSEIGARTLAPA